MAVFVVRRERIIPIPIDVIWQLVEPAAAMPAWLPTVNACRLISGQGLGRRQRAKLRRGRSVVEVDQEVTAYEPNATLSWREAAGPTAGTTRAASEATTMTVRLESIGPGTRVVLEARVEPAGMGASIRFRLRGRRRLGRSINQALDRLLSASA